jgi:hypothetical protein
MNGHEELLDSVALLALGVLPADEARAVAEHARGCPECRAEYADLRAAADAVAYAAELRVGELDELSVARLKANVMNAVRTSNGVAAVPGFAPEPLRSPERARPRAVWFPYFVAAAAVIAALVSTSSNVTLRSEHDAATQQVATLQSQLDLQTRIAARERETDRLAVAALTAPGSTHFKVASGDVVRGGGRIYLALHMAALPPGKVYQAWTLHAGAKTMTPSITFVPQPGGIALVELPGSANGLAAVAVSVEPAGGSKAPTSTPAFVRILS